MPLMAPRIAGLEFIRVLGEGGQAQVFQFAQQMPYRQVAVKVLKDPLPSSEVREQFFTEANLMASLEHPYIVSVYSAGTTADGRPFLVMQYYPHASLAERVRRERLRVEEVVRIGIQVGSAVETAHQAGVLHRDIKPHNILTNQYGAPGLSDFGIASQVGMVGAVTSFSAPWAPPEVLADDGRVSVASDVYSLGATLWHLLVGHSPFAGREGCSLAELMRRIREVPAPVTGRGDVPRSLEALLQAMLAKEPALRPPSAFDVVRTLQGIERELGFPPTEAVMQAISITRRAASAPGDDLTRVRAAARRPIDPTVSATALKPPPPVPDLPPASLAGPGRPRQSRVWIWSLVGVVSVLVVALVVLGLNRLEGAGAAAGPTVTMTPPRTTTTVTASSAPAPATSEAEPAATASERSFRVLSSIGVMHAADGLALDPQSDRLFCASWGNGKVSVVDLATRTRRDVKAGSGTAGLALDSTTRRLFASNSKGDDVTVFDADTMEILQRLPTGNGSAALALDSAAGRLYVGNQFADSITVVDTGDLTIAGVITGVTNPRGLAVDPASGLLYASNGKGTSVAVVDVGSRTKVGTIRVGSKPLGVTLDAAAGVLYVANSGSNTLSVVDTSTRDVRTVPVGSGPMAAAADPGRGLVYVTNLEADSVSVIDTESWRVLDELGVGDAPEIPLVDPSSHRVYVSNWYSGTVSVIGEIR